MVERLRGLQNEPVTFVDETPIPHQVIIDHEHLSDRGGKAKLAQHLLGWGGKAVVETVAMRDALLVANNRMDMSAFADKYQPTYFWGKPGLEVSTASLAGSDVLWLPKLPERLLLFTNETSYLYDSRDGEVAFALDEMRDAKIVDESVCTMHWGPIALQNTDIVTAALAMSQRLWRKARIETNTTLRQCTDIPEADAEKAEQIMQRWNETVNKQI